jgi:ABC-type Zn uptake system ZnuABC Zn-binding protein ZnuA
VPGPRIASALLCAVLAGAAIAGCADSSGSQPGNGGPAVVATTTQVADLVREVGGDRPGVTQILQPNSDPHEYEPRPSDAAALTGAAVVFRSGGDVDGWMDGLIDNAGSEARTVPLIDSVQTRRRDGDVDPHWWQDPRNAELAVAAIRDALIEADPGGERLYRANAAAYLDRLRRLDRQTAACIDAIPAAQRKLVTSHDALGYYADRYGIETIGAVIPSLSTQAQPSAKDVQALVDQIERTRVKAIFPERSINPKLERAVARETGAATGAPLWGDTLGPKGSDGASYVGSIASNTGAIVEGLTGGERSCTPEG